MCHLILLMSVLAAVAHCSQSLEDGKPSNSSCEKWELFESNKACLKKYIKHLLPEDMDSSVTSTPILRSTTVPTTVTGATITHTTLDITVPTMSTNATTPSTPMITNTAALRSENTESYPEIRFRSTPILSSTTVPTTVTGATITHATISTNATTPSTPMITNTAALRSENTESYPEMDCLSLHNVKERYSKNLKAYQKNKNFSGTPYLEMLQTGQQIRFDLLDKVFQQAKLKDLNNVDLHCIKVKKEELKNACLLKILKTTDTKTLFRNITYTMSRLKIFQLSKATCDLRPRLNTCVRQVLKVCPKALEMIADIENVTSAMCKDILDPPPTVSKHKGLPTIAVVFIVIACVCGAVAAAYVIFIKILKYRRSRGKFDVVAENNGEECEMTTIEAGKQN